MSEINLQIKRINEYFVEANFSNAYKCLYELTSKESSCSEYSESAKQIFAAYNGLENDIMNMSLDLSSQEQKRRQIKTAFLKLISKMEQQFKPQQAVKPTDGNESVREQQKGAQTTNQYHITIGDGGVYVGGDVKDAAVGASAKYQSDNAINGEQKDIMTEVIKQAQIKMLEAENNVQQLDILAKAKTALANANDQLPVADDPQTRSFLQTLWQGMKELDASASMTERGIKYIAPLLTTAIAFFTRV